MAVTPKEKDIVRTLAAKVAEVSAQPIQQEKIDLWTRHNSLKPGRPMVLIFPEGAWGEMLPWSVAECTDDIARICEMHCRQILYYEEHMRDDNVVEPVMFNSIKVDNTGYGVEGLVTRPTESMGAAHYDPVLVKPADFDKLRVPEFSIDWEDTNRRHEQMQELLGEYMVVQDAYGWGNHWGFCPMDILLQWRGIDNLFMDLVDNPELVHMAMQVMLDGKLAELEFVEKAGALTLNNRGTYNGSGGVSYTDELPQPDFDGQHVRPKDLWAMATAQIFSEVSPAMHDEFALTYEKQFLERFGLSSYGCCEPLHNKIDILRKISNLRRISISPWANVARCAELLRADYVYNWKPNPAVMAGTKWDGEAVRKDLREFCEKTRGCVVEMVMKDTHTCANQPQRMWDWVKIAKEVAEESAV